MDYQDNEVLPSVMKEGMFDKTERMIIYTFPRDVVDDYTWYYSNAFSRAYPALPNPYPTFQHYYTGLSSEAKARIILHDLEKNPVKYYDPIDKMLRTRLKMNWQSLMPTIEEVYRPSIRQKYLRIIENGTAYTFDVSVRDQFTTWFQEQVERFDRVEKELLPTMAEYYSHLNKVSNFLFSKVKKHSVEEEFA